MRNQFPKTDRCDFCDKVAKIQSTDGFDLCRTCAKESIVRCVGCGDRMVGSVAIYIGNDNKCRCQLCDMEHRESLRVGKNDDNACNRRKTFS